jgi:hypothetical protein
MIDFLFRELFDRSPPTTGGRSNTPAVNGVGHCKFKILSLILQFDSKLLVRKFFEIKPSVSFN